MILRIVVSFLHRSGTFKGQNNRPARLGTGGERLLAAAFVLFLASCADASAPKSSVCGHNGFVIAPTATRPRDPDLFSPPEPPPAGDGTTYCPTPVGKATVTTQPSEGFVATDVVNLSLDIGSQEVQSVAAGDDMVGVGWVDEGVVYVALARGGNHFQVRRVDGGSRVSLAFSPGNRRHSWSLSRCQDAVDRVTSGSQSDSDED